MLLIAGRLSDGRRPPIYIDESAARIGMTTPGARTQTRCLRVLHDTFKSVR
jgi:hypothetical protein